MTTSIKLPYSIWGRKMTDRELLELAAKAAGYEIWTDIDGNLYTSINDLLEKPWDPLNDDGDALRLAVMLGLCIVFIDGQMFVARWYSEIQELNGASEPVAGKVHASRAAAVRLAIVRAAAEIGGNMK